MPTPQNSAAGDRFNFGYFLDADGLPIGNTKTRPAAGTSTNGGPFRFTMPKSATPTSSPQKTVTTVTGEDGGIQHKYPFDADNTQLTAITLAAQDLELAGLVQNMPRLQLAGGRYTYQGIANVSIPNVTLIFQSRSIRVRDGAQLWSGIIALRAQLTYNGRDGFTERGGATFGYDAAFNPVGNDPWGYTIVDSDGNPKQATTIPFEDFAHPVVMQAVTFDGIITAIPVDYPPVDAASSAVILSSQISGVLGSVAATVNAVQATQPYSVTVSAAPTPTARRGVVFYQLNAS